MATAITPDPIDFARLMGPVADRLLGEHNARMSKGNRLRWGNKGSMEVDVEEGWFDDHESGTKGGVLALIKHKLSCDDAGAFKWLEDSGLKDRKPIVAASRRQIFYDYCDEDGSVLYRVERRGKGVVPPFLQHGPDGKGGFHAVPGCMQGVRRVPYRLPELVSAAPEAIVFLCEGEKDADRLAGLSLVATTNPGGAGKFTIGYAPKLRGRRVVLLEDNDDAGRNHVETAADALKGVAAVVAILKLEGLPPKGDVSDWLDAGGSVEELKALAEGVLSGGSTSSAEVLPLLDPAAWFGVDAPEQMWALDEYIPWRQATYFTGPGSVGKSLLTQVLCTCIAAGVPFLGIETRQSVAVYVTCEDDPDVLHRRQKAICDCLGIRLVDLSGKLHLVSLMGELGNELCTFDDEDRITPSERFKQIIATMTRTKAQFIALDNVAHLFPEEIARNKVAAQVNLLNRLARDMDAAVLFLGHPNKEGAEYSGSTAWENQVRSRMFMDWEKSDGGNPDARVLSRSKSNYAPKGGGISFIWHQGSFVRLEDLPPSLSAEIGQVSQANAENSAFLRCLEASTKAQRAVSHNPGSNYAPKIFADMTEGKGFKPGAFKRAMERLIHIDQVRLDQPLWRGPNRVMKQGIKATADCTTLPQEMAENRAPTPAPTPCTDPHETRGNPARFNPPIYKYIPGAAHQAAAPSSQGLSKSASGDDGLKLSPKGMILAPGESDDDPVLGWDDDRRPRF